MSIFITEDEKAWDDKMDKEDRFAELVKTCANDAVMDADFVRDMGVEIFTEMSDADALILALDRDSFHEMLDAKINAEIAYTAHKDAERQLE